MPTVVGMCTHVGSYVGMPLWYAACAAAAAASHVGAADDDRDGDGGEDCCGQCLAATEFVQTPPIPHNNDAVDTNSACALSIWPIELPFGKSNTKTETDLQTDTQSSIKIKLKFLPKMSKQVMRE